MVHTELLMIVKHYCEHGINLSCNFPVANFTAKMLLTALLTEKYVLFVWENPIRGPD